MSRVLLSVCTFLALGFSSSTAEDWSAPSKSEIDAVYPQVASLYKELHRNPELSLHEEKTVTQRVANVLKHVLGEANVVEAPPIMAADDFAEYGHAGVPSLLFFIGAVNPTRFEAAKKNGEILPTPHSPFFAPDPEPSLRTGIEAETATILELLRQK